MATTPPTRAWRSATGWPPSRASTSTSLRPRPSWLNLNLVVWFGIIERQAIHRGTLDLSNVRELTTAINKLIAGRYDHAHPFVWTKTADQILTKANRRPASNTDH
jgi:hypothetical protein